MIKGDPIVDFLPTAKQAAVCFSVDDVMPATSKDSYEAGGDLERGALRFVSRLIATNPGLVATLFVTPDWRPLDLVPQRSLATRLPVISRYCYWTTRQRRDHLRVDRHPDFVEFLNQMAGVEVALHGLHHLHRGPNFAVEFQRQSTQRCSKAIARGLDLFARADLRHVAGFQPPAWNLPPALATALADSPIRFVSSARDLELEIEPDALSRQSGLHGASLIYPHWLRPGRLVHFTTNFQATSSFDRAFRIVDCGGLLSIKAHIFKRGGGHTMLDGLDEAYCEQLEALFDELRSRYGDSLWWTSMGQITDRLFTNHVH